MSGNSPAYVDNSASRYSKVGGSGPQASIQTSSKIRTTPSEGSSTSNLAKTALESLGGSSGGSNSYGTSSGGNDSLKSLAKNALESLSGSSGSKSTGSSKGGDDISSLARTALKAIDGESK